MTPYLEEDPGGSEGTWCSEEGEGEGEGGESWGTPGPEEMEGIPVASPTKRAREGGGARTGEEGGGLGSIRSNEDNGIATILMTTSRTGGSPETIEEADGIATILMTTSEAGESPKTIEEDARTRRTRMMTDEGGRAAIAGTRGVTTASVMTVTMTAAMRGGKTRRRRIRRGRRMERDEGRQTSMIMTSRTTTVRTAPAVLGGQGHPVTVTQVMMREEELLKRPCGHSLVLIQRTLRR